MLRLHFAGPDHHPLASAINVLRDTAGVALHGSSHTARATLDAMHSGDLDAVLFPTDWSDIMRTLRSSVNGTRHSPLILASEQPSKTVLVRALACGFDGTVFTAVGPAGTVSRISQIIDGSWSLENEPALRELAITPGLLTQQLVFQDSHDEQIADLLGTGLPDDDIAILMDMTIQQVRNRIANLLTQNELSYRTQLAVVRAASVKVPDFS